MPESDPSPDRDDATVVFLPHDVVEAIDDELGVRVEGVPRGTGVLVVRRGPDVGSHYLLDRPVTRIGRSPEADVFLDDITVSRSHAEVARATDAYTVRDLGSLNGTYLNRHRVDDAVLHHGDELQIGKFRMVFLAPGSLDAGDTTDV